jgi:hypothetical protein
MFDGRIEGINLAETIPTGLAVQDGNLEEINPQTKMRVTVVELFRFATEDLKVDYLFWGMEEPYYSQDVIPFLKNLKQ